MGVKEMPRNKLRSSFGEDGHVPSPHFYGYVRGKILASFSSNVENLFVETPMEGTGPQWSGPLNSFSHSEVKTTLLIFLIVACGPLTPDTFPFSEKTARYVRVSMFGQTMPP